MGVQPSNNKTNKMYPTPFIIVAVALVGVNAQAGGYGPAPTRPAPTGPGGYLPPTVPTVTEFVTTVTEITITRPTFNTITHNVVVTKTRDVRKTETLNTARVFTMDVTERQTKAERANTVTEVARTTTQSLVVSTVQGEPRVSNVVLTVTSTALRTVTQYEASTLRVTHVDNVVEQTVLPVLTVVNVDQVETLTVTETITSQVTSLGGGVTEYNY